MAQAKVGAMQIQKCSHTSSFPFLSFPFCLSTLSNQRKNQVCLTIPSSPSSTMTPTAPRVNIPKQGIVEGKLDSLKRVVKFLNVPYATVQERWRPAVYPEPWSGIRDATKQG